ncbi:MAG TPA: VWA domain-containing protein [Terriglobia bacterium]|nr:VWA domain-containing protein [Terriglobia bacterium]
MSGRLHIRVRWGSALPITAVWAAAVTCLFLTAPVARAQDSAKPEITSQDSQPSFQLRIQHNEVVVRVVVRDAKGRTVRGLQKDDFRIFDNKRLQIITHFAAEGSATSNAGAVAEVPKAKMPESKPAAAAPIVLPSRYMALYFDDVHLQFGDLAVTRAAAGRYLDANLHPSDRAAIFTSSGQDQLDFTDDRNRLHADLNKLMPRPIFGIDKDECPPLTPYQAYRIVHENDPFTLQAAQADAYICHCQELGRTDQQCASEATGLVMPVAVRTESRADGETHYAIDGLRHICQRMTGLPGQHTIVTVSPGFLTLTQGFVLNELVDLALRQNIVISTMDARGLYALIPHGDASQRPLVIAGRPDLEANKVFNQNDSAEREADVLEELASDTGGVYFHNSNDLDDGFRRAGSFPDASYVLAFAPPNLKMDGRLHNLKVILASNPDRDVVQARRGYFAPTKIEDAATLAKEQLDQMIFSQEEAQAIPLQVHTQYFEDNPGTARLSVLAHVDVSRLPFRKSEGRNVENLTVVTAVFDREGNCVSGVEKKIEFHLLDSTLERIDHSGLSTKTSLSVKAGTYLIREVVQESEGGAVSASNTQVDIP